MSAPGSTSPFVGPKPFEQDQADLFKGREHEVERLEALVLSRRAVLFYAASGVGKSSLINAGLIPKLRKRERGANCELLGVVRVSGAAGSDSRENVFTKSVLGQLEDGARYASLLDYLRGKYAAHKETEKAGSPIALLVIDQFEELFTSSPERWRERLPFMQGVLEALDACAAADPVIDRVEGFLFRAVHLRIVFCLREEYIAYLEQYYDLLPELRTARFRLEPLRREQARRAIVEPTQKAGRAFSEELVEDIIRELIEAPQVTTHDARPKPRGGWRASLENVFRRAFFHVPEVGHRDQQYVVEGEYVEPVQLQVICSDIWESAEASGKVISRDSLPIGWSVDVGLGRFYDQAIAFACRSTSEPSARASSLWSRVLAIVGLRSFSPIRLRRWISKSLITAMGTRAPVLMQDAEMEIPAGVLERLHNRYLLRLEPRFGANWLELAHDRLVGPIARSNARRIAAYNHKRAGLAFFALVAVVGGWGWLFFEERTETEAKRAVIADMKKEIATEPDLGVLIQACARSHLGSSRVAPECLAAEDLSRDIVINEGLERSVSRQPELDAYVHVPDGLGEVAELVRQDNAYRAILNNGQYFDASFEKPVTPSSGDFKAFPKCSFSNDIKGVGPTEMRSALRQCLSSDLLKILGLGSPAVAAIDAAREYAIASGCEPEGCAIKLVMLDGQGGAPILINHDVEPARPGGSISRIAASGDTLVYALCEQGSSQNCPATVQIYKLSGDRRSAHQIASLPGTFDIVAMAASLSDVAIAYRSIGGIYRVKVYPTYFVKPTIYWLPEQSRVFELPFDTVTSLTFDSGSRYLVAASGNGYLVHWDLARQVFAEAPFDAAKLAELQFAQSMTVSGNGAIVATALGIGRGGNLDNRCVRIAEIKDGGAAEIANSAKCADAGPPRDRMLTGWNVVAASDDGTLLAAANSFMGSGKSVLLRRHGKIFEEEDVEFPPDISAVTVSADGKLVVVGDRTEGLYLLEEANDGTRSTFGKVTYIGTIDSSCVRVSGPQHRVSAISFYGRENADFLAATQEGCLAFFEKGASGWKPQLIDTQMPDLVTASVSPDSRWVALGGASGRIQIWDLSNLTRPAATLDAHLPWPAAFAWLSPGKIAADKWMIFGNSRFGPVGAWLLHDNGDTQLAPAVSEVFPPTWIDKSGIVGVSAMKGSLLAATTDGRLLLLSKVGTPQAIVDRLIDRACEISRPLVGDKAFPPATAKPDDDAFISKIMSWSRARCQPKPQSIDQEAKG